MIPSSMGCFRLDILQALSFYGVAIGAIYTIYSSTGSDLRQQGAYQEGFAVLKGSPAGALIGDCSTVLRAFGVRPEKLLGLRS